MSAASKSAKPREPIYTSTSVMIVATTAATAARVFASGVRRAGRAPGASIRRGLAASARFRLESVTVILQYATAGGRWQAWRVSPIQRRAAVEEWRRVGPFHPGVGDAEEGPQGGSSGLLVQVVHVRGRELHEEVRDLRDHETGILRTPLGRGAAGVADAGV